jgi:hypothetical protein
LWKLFVLWNWMKLELATNGRRIMSGSRTGEVGRMCMQVALKLWQCSAVSFVSRQEVAKFCQILSDTSTIWNTAYGSLLRNVFIWFRATNVMGLSHETWWTKPMVHTFLSLLSKILLPLLWNAENFIMLQSYTSSCCKQQ